MLVKKYQKDGNKDKEIVVTIEKAVNSSLNLRSKIALIREFLSRVNADTEVDGDWSKYVDEQRENALVMIIKDEKLKDKETHVFIGNSFRDGVLKTTGMDVDAIMPAVSRFGGGGAGKRTETKKRVIDRLLAYFEKYLDLVGAMGMIHFYKQQVESALKLIDIKSKYDDIKASNDVTEIKSMINIYQIEFTTRV